MNIKISINISVNDFNNLFAESAKRARENFGEFWPKTPEMAAWEAIFASNSWPSPDLIGLAIEDWSVCQQTETSDPWNPRRHFTLTTYIEVKNRTQLCEFLDIDTSSNNDTIASTIARELIRDVPPSIDIIESSTSIE